MVAPRAVREELRRGLDLYRRGLGGDGLRGETVVWAQTIAYGDPVSADKARKMVAWFARHGASVAESRARERQRRQLAQGELRGRAPALVAWLLWGGDSGRAWASKIAKPNTSNNTPPLPGARRSAMLDRVTRSDRRKPNTLSMRRSAMTWNKDAPVRFAVWWRPIRQGDKPWSLYAESDHAAESEVVDRLLRTASGLGKRKVFIAVEGPSGDHMRTRAYNDPPPGRRLATVYLDDDGVATTSFPEPKPRTKRTSSAAPRPHRPRPSASLAPRPRPPLPAPSPAAGSLRGMGSAPNTVYGMLRDRAGSYLTVVHRSHDGTPDGVRRVASELQNEVSRVYDWSGVNSQWIATGANGRAAWAVSPNLAHVSPVGSDEAAYILGDLSRAPKPNAARSGSVRKANGRKHHASLQIESSSWPTPGPGDTRYGIYGVDYYDRGPVHITSNRSLLLAHLGELGVTNPAAFVSVLEAALRGIKNADVPTGSLPPRYLILPWRIGGVRGIALLNKRY